MNTRNYSAGYYLDHLEEDFSPSTFKYIKVGSFLSHFFDLIKPIDNKNKNISLYLYDEDSEIDEKEIENDLAVVAKDFIITVKTHEPSTKN